MGDPPDLPHLTAAEQDHAQRARQHLERTDLLADKPPRGVNRELLYEGRYAARGVLLLATQLSLARAGRGDGIAQEPGRAGSGCPSGRSGAIP